MYHSPSHITDSSLLSMWVERQCPLPSPLCPGATKQRLTPRQANWCWWKSFVIRDEFAVAEEARQALWVFCQLAETIGSKTPLSCISQGCSKQSLSAAHIAFALFASPHRGQAIYTEIAQFLPMWTEKRAEFTQPPTDTKDQKHPLLTTLSFLTTFPVK